jgi:hypothetical protein
MKRRAEPAPAARRPGRPSSSPGPPSHGSSRASPASRWSSGGSPTATASWSTGRSCSRWSSRTNWSCRPTTSSRKPSCCSNGRRPTCWPARGPNLGRYWRSCSTSVCTGSCPAGRGHGGRPPSRVERVGAGAFEEARKRPGRGQPAAGRGRRPGPPTSSSRPTFLELQFFAPHLIRCRSRALRRPRGGGPAGGRRGRGRGVRPTRLAGAEDPAPRTDDQSDESHDFFHRLTRAGPPASKNDDTVPPPSCTPGPPGRPANLSKQAQDAAKEDVYHLRPPARGGC